MNKRCKVCVTGGTGYIGSCLVKKLLDKGYTVHATLRDLKNESKVGVLKSIPHSEGKLLLFEADIYNPSDFEAAIEGCEFVFHVATPLAHQPGSQYKDTSEASVGGIKSIMMCCERAGTVKRLIYTASVVSASPLKHDQTGFNHFMDETCWTPLNHSFSYLYPHQFYKDYVYSKTLTEKHILSYEKNENGSGLEVVTLPCGLVGGDTLQSSTPGSVAVLISQVTHDENAFKSLEFLENLLGKIPIVHVDDVCEAHIFCMENNDSVISGRYLCAYSNISSKDIRDHYALHYPQFNVKQGNVDVVKKDIKWSSRKLCEKGFVYRYDTKMILDDSIKCATRLGDI